MNRNVVSELQRTVGKRWVLHAPEDLLVYEFDGTIDKGMPEVVVLPQTAEQVAEVVRIARRHGLPVTARGAGTGLSGGSLACEGGVIVVTSRLNRILSIEPENRTALVEPGVINLDVSRAVAPHGLYYAPDPSSQRVCTVGGNVAENAGGPHSLRYGVTVNHVLGLEVVTPDGELVWLGGDAHRSGYDLTGVFVGAEGTTGIATKALLRLLPLPESSVTLLAIFNEVDDASRTVSSVIGHGIVPAALELMDRVTVGAVEAYVHAGYPSDAGAVLLIDVEGLREETAEQMAEIQAICEREGAREVRVGREPAERERLWLGRRSALGALGRLAPSYYIVDGVVPRTKLPEVLRGVYAICERYEMMIANVFHAGDGNLHPHLMFDERVPGSTERALDCGGEIMRLCVDVGGSITGEHGVGFEKRNYMSWIFSEDDLIVMSRLKAAFGEGDSFNPRKVFPTSKGCGEVSSAMSAAIAKVGPGAYI